MDKNARLCGQETICLSTYVLYIQYKHKVVSVGSVGAINAHIASSDNTFAWQIEGLYKMNLLHSMTNTVLTRNGKITMG